MFRVSIGARRTFMVHFSYNHPFNHLLIFLNTGLLVVVDGNLALHLSSDHASYFSSTALCT